MTEDGAGMTEDGAGMTEDGTLLYVQRRHPASLSTIRQHGELMMLARIWPAAIATIALAAVAAPSAQSQTTTTLTLTRDVRFGSATDTTSGLEMPTRLVVGAGGDTYIFDRRSARIKVYDRNGSYLRFLGRSGNGPGEFPSRTILGGMGFLGDTVWASSGMGDASRITFFPARGTPHSVALPYDPRRSNISMVRIRGMLTSGLALAQGDGRAMKGDTAARQRNPIVALNRAASVVDTLAAPPIGEVELHFGRMIGSQWFRDDLLWQSLPDGSGVLLVDRTFARTATGASFTITRLDANGRRRSSISYPYTPTPIRAALIDSLMAEVPARYGSSVRPLMDDMRRNLVTPPLLPTITSIATGRDGSVWLQREPWVSGGRRWTLVDARGAVVGDALLPTDATMLYGDSDAVYLIERNADDIPFVVRWRVSAGS
jgi:hypothetical protein